MTKTLKLGEEKVWRKRLEEEKMERKKGGKDGERILVLCFQTLFDVDG